MIGRKKMSLKENDIYEEDKKEAYEEMECWVVQEHIKKCDKCRIKIKTE
jgi:hypothetical protein